ncbi:MAG: hypothetical protein WAT53_00175 [Nitrosomonas sp.]
MNLYAWCKLFLFFSFFLIAMQIAGYSFSQPQGMVYLKTADNRTRISPQEAAVIVQQSIGGRVLSVNMDSSGYRVKILNNKGHIQIVTVDVLSGAILSTR